MNMQPKQIVAELDRFIIGQADAKRAVAVALRNRYRRTQLPEKLQEEITPKNIIMKGPTGVGKTEIARRLAKLVKAPFVKVEATKFTEVGYVGRDVDSMIRDLAEVAVRLVREEKLALVEVKARKAAEKRIVDVIAESEIKKEGQKELPYKVIRENVLRDLHEGKLDKQEIEIEIYEAPKAFEVVPGSGTEINFGEMFGGMGAMFGGKSKKRKVCVKDALRAIITEESEKLLDKESINSEAVRRAEQEGIIFIDEIDKIAAKSQSSSGHDVSREGVQRDILPIVEGSTVQTKYGTVRTDYILFIASGAFHIAKMSDLIPELQGRFPIRVELNSLTATDFVNILTQPENAITRQYAYLLEVDNIALKFKKEAIDEIAKIAAEQNETSEDIGARRLHTIMERLLEDISFNADGKHPMIDVNIDKKYVVEHLSKTVNKQDLKKYVL
ncbi:MAG: ATP-dependent protease ATPase subunit HslU [Clostridiales bacterium]|jgi:ATP-dependent HslUV protease ATP-binding subunit HslU|nr:ATP-dependent protease ATPase subunit HslU [Clostridiales bacterium]